MENEGKVRFRADDVIKYWLSDLYGFYSYNGNVVQVNPVEIYSLHFIEEKDVDFQKVVSEVTVIDIREEANNWAYSMFKYYTETLMGFIHSNQTS